MPSLRTLLRDHGPVLWLDAASATVHVGRLDSPSAGRSTTVAGDAGTGLFRAVHDLGIDLSAVRSLVFCEGPGSILGIRTAAVAVRTWNALLPRPIFAYRSLELLAAATGRPGESMIADARRDSWHCLTLGPDGTPCPLRRVATADLPTGLVRPEGFRQWSALPFGGAITTRPYEPAQLLLATLDLDLHRPCPEPDAFLHEDPTYVTWTPHVHQAPAAPHS